ncbi:MAG: hypothetical protein ETSY1_23675 [Candidatus Entotheonella factor]|uniref:Multidrug-efflux transporter n=2 Tax=Candidatus Entotheonella TaxID=93171 RepID=W4LGF0_ENTF1|nr:MAG: hypothetical protein ETSY1_23675 [Candidatus Entotheonella factor]
MDEAMARRLRAQAAIDDQSWWAEWRATVRLALPLIAAQLGQIAIHTTDVVMMGWLGPQPLAAGILGHQVYFMMWLFGLGVLTAVAPLAAQAIGAQDHERVRKIVQQGLWLALGLALPIGWILWHTETILEWLGQDEGHALAAGSYLRATLWGMGPGLAFGVLRSFVSALSRPRCVMIIMLAGVGLNILSNYALMFGHFGLPRLELVGAGISSSLVNTLMCASLLAYLLWDAQFRGFHLLRHVWCPAWDSMRQILGLGLPIGAAMLCESGMFAGAVFMIGWIGTTELAAHAVAMQCAAVSFMVPLGIAQASTVRVGLAAGRHDLTGIGRAGWTALGLGVGFMAGTGILFLSLPKTLVGFFLDLHGAETAPVVQLAIRYLAIAALFQLVDGAQVVGSSILRGLNDTRIPFGIAAVGYWGVGFGTAYLLGFPLGMEGTGVWLGLASGLAATALAFVWRFHRRERFGLLAAFRGENREDGCNDDR